MKIPFFKPWITKDDENAVIRALRQRWLTNGPNLEKFEKRFSGSLRSKYSLGVSAATHGLHLCLAGLKISPGDEVILPTFTFSATADAVEYCGGKPVFVDVSDDSFNILPTKVKQKINKKTKAIIAVHYGGQSCDMNELMKISKKANIPIIEDCAHALGSLYNSKKCGTIGSLGCFSFYPTKIITTGEGGMVTTNNKEIYNSLLKFRTHGIHKNANFFVNKDMAFDNNKNVNVWYYEMSKLGLNYRITDIQSVLGESQLRKIDKFIDMRRKIAKIYNIGFAKNDLITTPLESSNVMHAYHLYTILIDFEKLNKNRNQVMQELRAKNIGTQVLYIPVHLQPYYSKKYGFKKGDFPAAEKYYQSCLSIPIFPHLKEYEVNYVINKINLIISKRK